mgnify:CR=1 FL=1
MCGRLTRVNDNKCANSSTEVRDGAHGVCDSKDIRNRRHRNNSSSVGHDRFHGVDGQLSSIRDGGNANQSTRLPGHLLPRDEVRMVFSLRNNNLVAGRESESSR